MQFAVLLAALAAPFAAALTDSIRGVSSPIFHLYMQPHPNNASMVVMGPEKTLQKFVIGKTIQSSVTQRYLNIGADTTSYKRLSFDTVQTTDAWGLEGDTIITTNGSKYGRQLNFLVCSIPGGFYEVYLQTGSAVPSGLSCSNYQSLHLPCLCDK